MTVEERLRTAARDLAAMPVPDLEPAVRRRLAAPAPPRRLPAPRPTLAATMAGVLLVLGVLSAWPGARLAVADFLGLGGLRVEMLPERPPVGRDLRLGRRLDLRALGDRVDFPVGVPAALGAPDEVWLDEDAVPGGQVTLLWRPRADLPASSTRSTIGALLTVLPAELEPGLLSKTVFQPDTVLTSVAVEGADGPGWWLSGPEHALVYRDADGRVRQERSRLAGDTLLWQAEGVLYRLESGLSLDAALAVAGSLR